MPKTLRSGYEGRFGCGKSIVAATREKKGKRSVVQEKTHFLFVCKIALLFDFSSLPH